ncbi:hypothetical protein [Pararhizobium sp. O133]|uniref:hypothetical protein n=1 Tax=Pararhizobium sp. O133 TaxID=3449278 RepID=UPI003F684E54
MRSEILELALLLFKIVCSVIIFFALAFTLFAVGPVLETRYWPVVSKLQILSIDATADGQTRIDAAFRKLRDCEYLGLSWFVGDRPNEFERVAVQLMRQAGDTSSPDRPVGYQRAGPWIVGLSPDDLKGRSFARLTHRCHPFWPTTTEFFP